MTTYTVRHNGATYIVEMKEIHEAIKEVLSGIALAHFRLESEAKIYVELLRRDSELISKFSN